MFKKRENLKDRVGETHKNKAGEQFVIIKCRRSSDLDVLFEDGTIVTNRRYQEVVEGQIKNLNSPSIFGVGYLGQGEHTAYIEGERTKKDRCWRGILRRCYREKEFLTHPTYKDVNICKEWHNFQNFAKWHEGNYNPETMKDWHLDKDVLVKGNKIYSPETCCFVPAEINITFRLSKSVRGNLPIGVHKSGRGFKANITKNNIKYHLGTFDTVEEAFQAYKIEKESYIKELAEIWKPQITPQTYKALINYQVEITD